MLVLAVRILGAVLTSVVMLSLVSVLSLLTVRISAVLWIGCWVPSVLLLGVPLAYPSLQVWLLLWVEVGGGIT
jgi:hypothetical protein